MNMHAISSMSQGPAFPDSEQRIVRPTIHVVVMQHAEDSAALRHTRSVLVRAPHVKLHHLRRLDDRIAAHLDGLVVAGPDGWRLAIAELESPGTGQTFAAATLAILHDNAAALDKLLALAEAELRAARGVISALGWVSAQSLRSFVAGLLASSSAFHQQAGLATCAMHRVDPGAALNRALVGDDSGLRARALRVAGEAGRLDCLRICLSALADEDIECRFQSARACLLLGDRNASFISMQSIASSAATRRDDALRLLLKLTTPQQSHAVLHVLSHDEATIRSLIQGVGVAGDPHYVPWLIKQMSDLKLARLAGESFSTITGLDLAHLDLEVKPPDGTDFGPTDDPADDNVAMDQDDSLPWPDPLKIAAWWDTNGVRFVAGRRYFMGEEPSWTHCLDVLHNGFQRQRIAAAEYLCLLKPGTGLFPAAAPAWRQKRWLNQMA